MFNTLLGQSWWFFQQHEQKGGEGLYTFSLEIANKTALFTPKFSSDALLSLLTSFLLVLGIRNDPTSESWNQTPWNQAHNNRVTLK